MTTSTTAVTRRVLIAAILLAAARAVWQTVGGVDCSGGYGRMPARRRWPDPAAIERQGQR